MQINSPLWPLCLVFDQLFARDLAAVATATVSAPLFFFFSCLTPVSVFAKLSAVKKEQESKLQLLTG